MKKKYIFNSVAIILWSPILFFPFSNHLGIFGATLSKSFLWLFSGGLIPATCKGTVYFVALAASSLAASNSVKGWIMGIPVEKEKEPQVELGKQPQDTIKYSYSQIFNRVIIWFSVIISTAGSAYFFYSKFGMKFIMIGIVAGPLLGLLIAMILILPVALLVNATNRSRDGKTQD